MKSILTTFSVAILATALSAQGQNIIADATDPFTTSFRNGANTTYFGWIDGTFDGASEDEQVDNPAVTIGTAVAGISFTQLTTGDILASSNNIYNGVGPNSNAAALTLIIPTSGAVGSGFTTIIVQGRATTGGPTPTTPTTPPGFGNIIGFETIEGVVTPVSVSPTLVWGRNSGGRTQWWVKYEIPSNSPTYILPISMVGGTGVSPTSIANLQVDTFWSETGYAPDVAFATTPPAPPTPTVDTPPTISVSGKKNRTVGANAKTINLSGTAADNIGISGIYYSGQKGGLKLASGTNGWRAKVRLAAGKNVITVFAVDSIGLVSASEKIIVTRK